MNDNEAFEARKKLDSYGPIPARRDPRSTASGVRGPGLEKERTKLAKLEAEGTAIFEEAYELRKRIAKQGEWEALAKRRLDNRVAMNEAAAALDAKREATKHERAEAARARRDAADARWINEVVPVVTDTLEAIATAEEEERAALDRNPNQLTSTRALKLAGGTLWPQLQGAVASRHTRPHYSLDGANFKLWKSGEDCVDLDGNHVPATSPGAKIIRSYAGMRDVPLGLAGVENA
jgi:hypothetical protein